MKRINKSTGYNFKVDGENEHFEEWMLFMEELESINQ
jgi:hypothetical protein